MLEELVTKNDFEFINTLENDINEIHTKILNQKNKMKQIITLLKSVNKQNDINNIDFNYANEIIKLTNSNIKSLYSIEVNLNNLCQDFAVSYTSNLFKQNSNLGFDSIKANTNAYSSELADFDKTFTENNLKIDEFLKNYSHLTSDNTLNINTSNNIASLDIDAHTDNPYLTISEKEQKVFLPYKVSEINDYLKQYPNNYSSFEDVVKNEFIVSLDYYTKNPIMARFRETYALIRDREGKSVIEALKYSFDLMFKDNLNPTIIAACKTEQQLNDYLDCLEHQKLDDFKHFKIQFYITPLTSKV